MISIINLQKIFNFILIRKIGDIKENRSINTIILKIKKGGEKFSPPNKLVYNKIIILLFVILQ